MLINTISKPVEFRGRLYDQRHGGPFDRGAADSYYHRPFRPHFFPGPSYRGPEISGDAMTTEEVDAYRAGYAYNEQFGEKKDWG